MISEVKLNNENFKEELSKGTHLVELGGDGCSGCAALNPVVHKLIQQYDADLIYHYVFVTHEVADLCKTYNIDRIPTLLFMHDGIVMSTVRGFQPEEVLELWLEDEMSKIKK